MAESSCDMDFGLVLSIELAYCLGSCIVRRWMFFLLPGGRNRGYGQGGGIHLFGFMIDDQTTQTNKTFWPSQHNADSDS